MAAARVGVGLSALGMMDIPVRHESWGMMHMRCTWSDSEELKMETVYIRYTYPRVVSLGVVENHSPDRNIKGPENTISLGRRKAELARLRPQLLLTQSCHMRKISESHVHVLQYTGTIPHTPRCQSNSLTTASHTAYPTRLSCCISTPNDHYILTLAPKAPPISQDEAVRRPDQQLPLLPQSHQRA